uniref:Uncharacterized protein n=1 Tax=Kalanchoe fedtschenkoi TaxID=63787 RepID=A0A7N0V773_KALFE
MVWGGVMAAAWGYADEGWRKGPWTAEEDKLLTEHVTQHGEGRWNSVSRLTGLKRNGKSCRLRWVNYLRPDLKRGQITPHEETIILELHARWGNRWSTIARSLPGRTDNEIKNYWRTHFKKKGTKAASHSAEKAKTRLLRRQQFQQQQQIQQQQQQQQQYQQQQQIFSQVETKASTNGCAEKTAPYPYWPQQMLNLPDSTYLNVNSDQGFFYAMLNDNSNVDGLVPEPAANNESAALWDGLWNLDDVV